MPCNFASKNSSAAASSSRRSAAPSKASKPAQSALEKKILAATSPIDVSETETVSIAGETGIFVNKKEVDSFKGPIALSKYKINVDSNPEVIQKSVPAADCKAQQVRVKFLQPAAAGAGDITIVQEPNTPTPAAPPVIIRQEPEAACDAPSKTIREEPPCVGAPGPVEISVPGCSIPPPARRVIVEKIASVPAGPGKVTVERWLAAPQGGERKVIFKPATNGGTEEVKNLVIEWSQPECDTETEFKFMGTKDQCPVEYREKYGRKLKSADRLPSWAQEVDAPSGKTLAVDAQAPAPLTLSGDVAALKLVKDLAQYGLEEYASQIRSAGPAPKCGVSSSSKSSKGCAKPKKSAAKKC